MDRSFLSQADVIAAARKFTCIRLSTYEDEKEAWFLKGLFVGRSGDMENTTFTILSPDGKQVLVPPSRSVRHSLGTTSLAETMNRIALQFPSRKTDQLPELPRVTGVRLALNVAACDNQPLALLHARDEQSLKQIELSVRELAWSDEFEGRFVYSATTSAADLKEIEGVETDGLIVVQPDRYGLKGKVLTAVPGDRLASDLAATLRTGVSLHQRAEKSREHIRAGQQQGVFWETSIPVSDPKEKVARETGRRPAQGDVTPRR